MLRVLQACIAWVLYVASITFLFIAWIKMSSGSGVRKTHIVAKIASGSFQGI